MKKLLVLAICVAGVVPFASIADAASDPAQTEAPATMKSKRAGPADVPPVTIKNTRYSAIHWGRVRGLKQNGGYISASDARSGKELWTLQIYDTKRDAGLEQDVQDVFIVSIKKGAKADTLEIQDEAGRSHIVDVKKRSVHPQ